MTPQDKRRATLRARQIRDTAYHEAGHVVGYWHIGVGVSLVHARCDQPYSRRRIKGETSADVVSLLDDRAELRLLDEADVQLAGLIADAVDHRRAVPSGNHVLSAQGSLGTERTGTVLAAAVTLVETYWPVIEAVAEAIIASPDHELERRELIALRERLTGVMTTYPAAAALRERIEQRRKSAVSAA